MAGATSCLNFAVIGHQDSWENIERFVNGMRLPGQEKLPVEKIRHIFPFIPPRVLFKVKVNSAAGTEINGVYIDSFIDPDKLEIQYTRANINKVMQAAGCAAKQGASITTLGGFTSILQEGNFDSFPKNGNNFTTGNTLTSAFIVKGVEAAARIRGINVDNANLLVLGATGDIGMACIQYFKKKVKRLLLCARNQSRLEKLAGALTKENIDVLYHVAVNELVPAADIIICVASSTGMELGGCRDHVLICDAGYPKNLDTLKTTSPGIALFHGGMGQVSRGFHFEPDYSTHIYRYPAPNIAHGCILEAMVLAFEQRFENYSTGKGNISIEKMEEIYACALKHGINLAPFHNANGLWPQQTDQL